MSYGSLSTIHLLLLNLLSIAPDLSTALASNCAAYSTFIMIQVEQAAQLEADKRGAEVGGNAEQVEEQEMYGRGGTV